MPNHKIRFSSILYNINKNPFIRNQISDLSYIIQTNGNKMAKRSGGSVGTSSLYTNNDGMKGTSTYTDSDGIDDIIVGPGHTYNLFDYQNININIK